MQLLHSEHTHDTGTHAQVVRANGAQKSTEVKKKKVRKTLLFHLKEEEKVELTAVSGPQPVRLV